MGWSTPRSAGPAEWHDDCLSSLCAAGWTYAMIPFRCFVTCSLLAVACLSGRSAIAAVVVGELDTFASTLEGWAQGETSTVNSGITRAASGGPTGASDAYMRILSDTSREHGKMIVYNRSAAWTGNYISAGVESLSMAVNNLGATDLMLRLAFGTTPAPDSLGTWLSSTNAVNVPSGSGWMNVQFQIGPTKLTTVSGSASYSTVMSGVSTLRLLHSTTPNSRGVAITAVLGVDNILAVGAAPIPGDFDSNRRVDGADLAKWRMDFGANGSSDADGDGDSDGHDFLVWQRQLGSASGSVAAVPTPEPPSAALLAAALAFLPVAVRLYYPRAL
jgi:hypothetical protein